MSRFHILAVCTANICRSPLVEILLRQRLDPEVFSVASAGVQGWREAPVDSMVVLELERFGARADGFASRALAAKMISDADLVLTATRDQRSEILSRHPDALRRTFTLREFAGLVENMISVASPAEMVAAAYRRRGEAGNDLDLPDPFRRPPEVHRLVADQVAEAVSVVAERLSASLT
jgi:low molecular weight protein-tyrosine phosphatase